MDTNNNGHTVFGWRITTPQVAAIFLAGVYVAGFLVLNAHLSKRGVFDLGLANSRYLIAGINFVVFLVFWYLFAGRAIISIEKGISEEIKSAIELGLSRRWHFVIRINFFIGLVFFTCISAAFFSITLLGSLETIIFFIYLSFFLLIICIWGELFEHNPRVKKLFKLITGTVAIVIFFITIDIFSMTMIVFLHFFFISGYVILVLFLFERFGIIKDQLKSEMISLAIFVLFSSVSFGWLHYENIKSYFGGGQPQEVEIIVVDQTVRNSLETMGFKVKPFLKAKLIHENQQEFIIEAKDQIVRLSRKTVAGFRVLPVKDSHKNPDAEAATPAID